MSDKDGITPDARSREDEYFRRQDRELIERMRRAAETAHERQQLEAKSGLHDPALLQELEALGFTAETVVLLPLVPIVQTAWAEAGVSDEERALIVRFARERGIEPGSAADEQLAVWLTSKPSDHVFTRGLGLVRAMLESPDAGVGGIDADDLMRHCEEIAAASGGLFGFRKISGEERTLLGQLEQALKSK